MEKNMIYSTKQDYIGRVVVPALGGFADGFDADAIADDMLIWHDEINDKGQINLGESGFMSKYFLAGETMSRICSAVKRSYKIG